MNIISIFPLPDFRYISGTDADLDRDVPGTSYKADNSPGSSSSREGETDITDKAYQTMRFPVIRTVIGLIAGTVLIGACTANVTQTGHTTQHSTYWTQGYDYGSSPQMAADLASRNQAVNSGAIQLACVESVATHPSYTTNAQSQYIAGCIAGYSGK